MSETFPGLPAARPPPAPRLAAVALLFRRRPEGGVELFWVKREKTLAFGGGFYAYPGGKVDRDDAAVPVEGFGGEEAALRACAARELFEEAGVLLAPGAAALAPAPRERMRRALLEGQARFADLLREAGLALDARALLPAGRWVTPPFVAVRFDAHFFLVELPGGQQAQVWPGELAEGAWVTPAAALERWAGGSALLHPPTLHALRVMEAFGEVAQACERLALPAHCPGHVAQRVEYQQGVRVVPLQTPTLPPAAYTNAYVLGHGELLLVDPGAADPREYARLLQRVAGLETEEGCRPRAVVLTHHHADHVGGAHAVAERLGVPIWCHARTAGKLPFRVARHLEEGEVLELAGRPVQRWRVLHTPGHARGHVCLVDERTRAAVVGDMVASASTIVIDPPEGDMADYLAQLRRLKELPVGTLYPAHGSPIPDGPAKLEAYLAHRAEREAAVLAALAPHGARLEEVVARVYTDTPPFMHPVAERSALATLIKLEREGRVEERSGRYVRR